MALYKDNSLLHKSGDAVFDHDRRPGETAPASGIYRCMGCGHEVVSEENEPLPPPKHHQHTASQGKMRWRLIVYAEHMPGNVSVLQT